MLEDRNITMRLQYWLQASIDQLGKCAPSSLFGSPEEGRPLEFRLSDCSTSDVQADSGLATHYASFFFNLNFIFLLYNIVLVLPYINMNPPQVYINSQKFIDNLCQLFFLYHLRVSCCLKPPYIPILCMFPKNKNILLHNYNIAIKVGRLIH